MFDKNHYKREFERLSRSKGEAKFFIRKSGDSFKNYLLPQPKDSP